MVKVGILGASGYAGEKLIEILLRHPKVKITYLAAKIEKSENISHIYPHFAGKIDLVCENVPDLEKIAGTCDLVFLALPHTVSMDFVPLLLQKNIKVIDLSADYRLKDTALYEKWYAQIHKDKKNNRLSVYGLPELYRQAVKKAEFIANPGCYPTAAVLGIAPLLKKKLIAPESVIIDAKSGYSGAGRERVEKGKNEILNNFKAYKVNMHQHAPEINQELSRLAGKSIEVVFVPHLLPVEVGILETIYIKAKSSVRLTSAKSVELYKKFYKDEPFVRIKEEGYFPQLSEVVGTNFCDIGIKADGCNIIIISAIDNLIKGASGQAVQNMNIMYGFEEEAGLGRI